MSSKIKVLQVIPKLGYGGAEMRAISALDIALWDIKGQALDLPIFELIGGGTRHKVRVYNTLGVYGEITDGHDIWRRPVDVAQSLLDEGIGAMKFSPTDFIARASDGQLLFKKDLDWALAPWRKIREALGMEIDIANNSMIKCYRKCKFLAAGDYTCLFMSIKIMISLKNS